MHSEVKGSVRPARCPYMHRPRHHIRMLHGRHATRNHYRSTMPQWTARVRVSRGGMHAPPRIHTHHSLLITSSSYVCVIGTASDPGNSVRRTSTHATKSARKQRATELPKGARLARRLSARFYTGS